MEWNKKNIFRIFFSSSCLGVLTEGMKSSFPCLRVQVGGNRMVKREYSFLSKPSKSQIFVPPKLGEIGRNGFRFNEIFIKILKIPLYIQLFILKQGSNSNIVIKLFHSIPFILLLNKITYIPFIFILFHSLILKHLIKVT